MSASPPPPAPGAQAQETASPERLKRLSEELRCLVCQNQTLADSNADLAVDLKRQIETLLAQGQSDNQIRDYMVARYGDFVLYRPPLQSNTLLLWIGPFAMLAGGGLLWWLIQRRNRLNRPAASTSVPTVSGAAAQAPEAMARARALLDR
ncbi:MAG: cytochrome c-type biogenesis protein CcmH [Betaproteobacteria bacterium]|nr:cytochrome c-type biogenesis protein CcmH [Betaproteobacteria bacterium]